MDSGATNHITTDLNNLSLQHDYKGKENIIVGNGQSLSISHTGSSLISSLEKPLLLNNILYDPEITNYLLSVSQITKDNNMFAEFHSDYCLFKDNNTKKVFLQGTLNGSLYQLDISKLEDGLKLGDSSCTASLSNNTNRSRSNKTCSFGSVSLLSNDVKTFCSSLSCNKRLTDSVTATSLDCTVDNSTTCKLANLWHS